MSVDPRTLLRLYPRPWRDRYADEFLEACGDRALSVQQVIDIVFGAIDARFVTQPHLAADGRIQGAHMPAMLKSICARQSQPYNKVDGLKGAAAMVVTSFALVTLAAALSRNGWPAAGQFFKSLSFPASFMLMSYFTFMKGQSATAKAVVIGGTLMILVAISAFTAAF